MKEAGIWFLKSILETNMELNTISNQLAQFLAGLSGVIMAITLTQIFASSGTQKIGFLIITLTCFIVIFISIGVIRPKIGKNKLNLMYYKGILKLTKEKYIREVNLAIRNDKKFVEEFCEEIYDLSLELKQKFRIIRLGADVLAVGLFIGIIMVFVG
jgi:hypothetical protein